MRPFTHLLVPLDGTPFAEQALPLVLHLARPAARLTLVHVHQPPTFGPGATVGGMAGGALGMPPTVPLDPQVLDDLARGAGGYLDDVAARLATRTAVQVTTRLIEHDDVAAALEEAVEDSGAELVVMASHDRSGLSRLFAGSVAEDLVRGGGAGGDDRRGVPVLVLRGGDADTAGGGEAGAYSAVEPSRRAIDEGLDASAPPLRRVLVALDGTAAGEAVLAAASALAETVGATLVLTGVHEPSRDARQTRPMDEYLAGVGVRLRDAGLSVETYVIQGSRAADGLLHAVRSSAVDAVAMATRGRRGLARLLKGSVATDLLRELRMPVLLVPTDESGEMRRPSDG